MAEKKLLFAVNRVTKGSRQLSVMKVMNLYLPGLIAEIQIREMNLVWIFMQTSLMRMEILQRSRETENVFSIIQKQF